MGAAYPDLKGTNLTFFKVGVTGPQLKASGQTILLRNNGDTADAALTVSLLSVSGDSFALNSDAAGSGADWTYTVSRPTAGLTQNTTLIFPPNGTAGQALVKKSGSPAGTIELEWATTGGASTPPPDGTSLAFNSATTVSMFQLPANAIIRRVSLIVDTPFNQAPTFTVGIAGNTAKYVGALSGVLGLAAGDMVEW
ncbi:MAG: hypothetical protein ACRC62_32325, partial [Microcoleus sp.]